MLLKKINMANNNNLGFSTQLLHFYKEKNNENAHLTPIYASSTFSFDSVEDGVEKFNHIDKKNIYSRWGNPSFDPAAETISYLESRNILNKNNEPLKLQSYLFASGQSAMSTLFMSNLQSGDSVLSHFCLYGGTQELIQKVLVNFGIKNILIDLNDFDLLRETISTNPSIKLIHIETPCNPLLQCVNIEAVCNIAQEFNIKVSVDNTFATPYLQQPFKFGADFVMHSTTKYLNGHGTAIGGILIGKDIDFMKTVVWKKMILLGGNYNPFDAFSLMNGLKTLEIRMERHCDNAMIIGNYLKNHHKIAQVYYTGLEDHPQKDLINKQLRKPSPMLSFEPKSGFEGATKFINQVKICTKAVSLGTLDTLVCHPASMTHVGISEKERLKYGLSNSLIRMSVGIESVADLISDIDQALN